MLWYLVSLSALLRSNFSSRSTHGYFSKFGHLEHPGLIEISWCLKSLKTPQEENIRCEKTSLFCDEFWEATFGWLHSSLLIHVCLGLSQMVQGSREKRHELLVFTTYLFTYRKLWKAEMGAVSTAMSSRQLNEVATRFKIRIKSSISRSFSSLYFPVYFKLILIYLHLWSKETKLEREVISQLAKTHEGFSGQIIAYSCAHSR